MKNEGGKKGKGLLGGWSELGKCCRVELFKVACVYLSAQSSLARCLTDT